MWVTVGILVVWLIPALVAYSSVKKEIGDKDVFEYLEVTNDNLIPLFFIPFVGMFMLVFALFLALDLWIKEKFNK